MSYAIRAGDVREYQSPYQDLAGERCKDFNGQAVTIVGPVPEDSADEEVRDDLWLARFGDGKVRTVWREEVDLCIVPAGQVSSPA